MLRISGGAIPEAQRASAREKVGFRKKFSLLLKVDESGG
jgi:hypothetical protein